MRLIDRIGEQYGRLTVIARAPNRSAKDTNARWACKCECGNVTIQYGQDLKRGKVVSCGCWNNEKRLTHGKSRSRVYGIWKAMIQRCENPGAHGYDKYGARGISVSAEWHDFEKFYSDMGDPPKFRDTIDREDSSAGYENGNCRWTSYATQNRNLSANRNIEFNGKTQCISDWAVELGMKRVTLDGRLNAGWSVEKAFTTPVKKYRPRKK